MSYKYCHLAYALHQGKIVCTTNLRGNLVCTTARRIDRSTTDRWYQEPIGSYLFISTLPYSSSLKRISIIMNKWDKFEIQLCLLGINKVVSNKTEFKYKELTVLDIGTDENKIKFNEAVEKGSGTQYKVPTLATVSYQTIAEYLTSKNNSETQKYLRGENGLDSINCMLAAKISDPATTSNSSETVFQIEFVNAFQIEMTLFDLKV